MVGSSVSDSPFIGRQREMAELSHALDDAISGHGRIVMLAGEPGIGKTRTAEELAAIANERGAQVLWGRCYDYAAMLVGARGHAPLYDGSRQAMYLLEEALSISTELGMRPLMEKAAALQESMAARPSRYRKYPANLTERQAEILRLIASGKTSREIAEVLLLSEYTVHRHVANIYTKIGARNRTEAAAFALRELYPII